VPATTASLAARQRSQYLPILVGYQTLSAPISTNEFRQAKYLFISALYDLLNCRLESICFPWAGHQTNKTELARGAFFTYKSTARTAFIEPTNPPGAEQQHIATQGGPRYQTRLHPQRSPVAADISDRSTRSGPAPQQQPAFAARRKYRTEKTGRPTRTKPAFKQRPAPTLRNPVRQLTTGFAQP
jgi:hypothetical protein